MAPEPQTSEVARRQELVVSRAQLAELDVDRHMIRRREADGAWRTLDPRVVVLHKGNLTAAQRRWVGILHADPSPKDEEPGAALYGLTAAEADGLTGFETRTVHVAVEHGREIADLRTPHVRVRIHRTRHLSPADVQPVRRPPRLRLPRAIVEAAADVVGERPGYARALVAAAVQQRLVRASDLETFIQRRPTLPGRSLILETVTDAGGGAHSLPELEFSTGLRRAGLPQPCRQRRLRRADGSYYLDNDFDEFDVTVEINGIQHVELLLKEADDVRRAALQISGRIVVDLSSFAVRHDIRRCVLVTAEALQARGYVPPPRTAARLAAYADAIGWTPLALTA